LIANLAGDLGRVDNDVVKYAMLSHFYKADSGYGSEVAKAVKADVGRVQQLAQTLTE
jgi:catalase